MSAKRPSRLIWFLEILRNAKPARVEPHDDDMRKVAHWAWSNGLANRHFTDGRVTYSISAKGEQMLTEQDARHEYAGEGYDLAIDDAVEIIQSLTPPTEPTP